MEGNGITDVEQDHQLFQTVTVVEDLGIRNSDPSCNHTVNTSLSPESLINVQPQMKFTDMGESVDCNVNSVQDNQVNMFPRNYHCHVGSEHTDICREDSAVGSNETCHGDLLQQMNGTVFLPCSIKGDQFQKSQEIFELHTSHSQQLTHSVPLQTDESSEDSQNIEISKDVRTNDISSNQPTAVDHQYASEYPNASDQQRMKTDQIIPALGLDITDIPQKYEVRVDFVNNLDLVSKKSERTPLAGGKDSTTSFSEHIQIAKKNDLDNSNSCSDVKCSKLCSDVKCSKLSDGIYTTLKSVSELGESNKQYTENDKDTGDGIDEVCGNNNAESKIYNKGSYRTLVERKSVFQCLRWGKEEKGLSTDLVTEHALKCGYCSEIFPEEDKLISHLKTHDSRVLKNKRSQPLRSSKRKKQSQISDFKVSKDSEESKSNSALLSCVGKADSENMNGENSMIKVYHHVCSKDCKCKFQSKKKEVQYQNYSNSEHNCQISSSQGKRGCKKKTDNGESDVVAGISAGEKDIKHRRTCTNNDASRNVMASVGKRNAKKKPHDDFIMTELTKKRTKAKATNFKESPKDFTNKSLSDKSMADRTSKFTTKEIKGRVKSAASANKSEPSCHKTSCKKKKFRKKNLPRCKSEKCRQNQAKASKDISDTSNICETERKHKFLPVSSSSKNVTKGLCTPTTVLRCVQCKGCFLWKQSFLDHLKIHPSKTPFQCFTCKKTFRTFFNLQLHIKRCHKSEKNLSCHKCNRTFRSKYLLKMHMTWHGDTISSQYTCNICNKSYAYKFILSRHMRKEHSVAKKRGTESYKCVPCGKLFSDSKCLWMHNKRHPNAVKPYKCEICQKRFALHGWLVDHIQRHNPVRKFPCNVCGKKYFTLSDAKMHQRRHSKEATFACTHCERKFIYKSELNAHIKRHLGFKLPKNVPCKICNKLFFTKRDLERHSLVHSGDKPYECPMCFKRFSQEINMRVHVKIHNGEKPYQCNVCEKCFIAKSKLLRHQQCHNTAKGKLPRPFKCVLCPRKYTAENSLVRHLRSHKDSPETIANISEALKKAVDEEGDVSENSNPGAVLAMMIDQAILDAKKLAKGRKKGREERPFASLIDQAIHDSKATSSSTQTPIIKMENIDNLDASITLSDSVDTAVEAESEKQVTRPPFTNSAKSCSDLLKLISDSLGRQVASDSPDHLITFRKSHNERSTPQTIIVSPKSSVINPNSSAIENTVQQVHHNVIVPNHIVFPSGPLKSLLEPSSTLHEAPVFQNLQVDQSSNDNQQSFIQNLNQSNFELNAEIPTEQEPFIVNPTICSSLSGGEQQIILPQSILASHSKSQHVILQSPLPDRVSKSVQIIFPAKGNNQLRTQPSFSKQPSGKTVQHFFLPQETGGLSRKEQVIFIPSGSNVKGDSNSILQLPASANKVRHIVVKTNEGQTFLIPSPVMTLNETSSIVASSTPTITDEGSNVNMHNFVEKVQIEDCY